jgi:hypothetical protein
MRHIPFVEFATIMSNATAVILDNNALSYPYVNEGSEDDIDNLYVEINYTDDFDAYEHTFYPDDTIVRINDLGNLELVQGEERYIVKVLDTKKLV